VENYAELSKNLKEIERMNSAELINFQKALNESRKKIEEKGEAITAEEILKNMDAVLTKLKRMNGNG
jgi:hypothetical protein